MKTVTILGATGSIGRQTLSVIEQHPEQFQVFALTANRNYQLLFSQCQKYNPRFVVCVDAIAAQALSELVSEAKLSITVLSGMDALCDVAKASEVDIVMAAIVGAAGLPSAIAAAASGKQICLANKEALVMSGTLFMQTAAQNRAMILPVDSEHNALFQCMPDDYLPGQGQPRGIERLVLTASGGPFRERPIDTLASVTAAEAVKHPNWSMGAKISVDSATMMNKGLEVIEAHWLFAMPHEKIDVVIHPQSIIHSLAYMLDGSVLAQMGMPDMCCPIANCLGWPDRIQTSVERLDLVKQGQLTFEKPDTARFPCLQLAFDALQAGQAATCALNAANEIAVAAFLQGQIGYLAIAHVVEQVLAGLDVNEPQSLGEVLEVDRIARESAKQFIDKQT